MRNLVLLLMVIAVMGMSGCAGKLMRPVEPAQMDETVKADEAAIVFFRSTTFGGAIQAPIVEADEGGNLTFVAVISAKTKYLHRTTPGRHLYVIGGESSAILEANMEAGKTYYTYIAPYPGFWKARFVFVPVQDTSNEKFINNFSQCMFVQNTQRGKGWFMKNMPSLQQKYASALKRYNETTAEDNSLFGKRIIKPEYGTNTPVQSLPRSTGNVEDERG